MLDRLLDTTFEAFAAHGYEGASMRQIARTPQVNDTGKPSEQHR
jgi:hypothetical protein